MTINDKLRKSKFRSSFKLSEKDKEYVRKKSLKTIEQHTKDFLNQRIKIKPKNDTKQTPFKGHPTFIAQHATATCCRKCIQNWYKIPKEKVLSDSEINYFKDIIMSWIKEEMNQSWLYKYLNKKLV